ncbi:squalene monooxygenase [Ranunculus cassubicifolius]
MKIVLHTKNQKYISKIIEIDFFAYKKSEVSPKQIHLKKNKFLPIRNEFLVLVLTSNLRRKLDSPEMRIGRGTWCLGYNFSNYKGGRSEANVFPCSILQSSPCEVKLETEGLFFTAREVIILTLVSIFITSVRLEQGTVTSLIEENGTIKGVSYKNMTGEELKTYAPLTVVCDGCFSNLRLSLCTPKVKNPSCFVGLILENCTLPFPNHGHVVLGNPSPILFYPISSTEIRCLVDVPGQKVPSIYSGEMANYLKTTIAPQVPPELHDSFLAAIDKGSIRTMPNRSMPADPHPTPGALLMGDAFNMRHPLTGGGMTVALSDIAVLQNLLKPLRDLNDASSLCRYLESFYTSRYQARKEMRQACFDYLSLGGVCSSGPVASLSGLNPRPLSLVCHFFAVAIFGVGRLLMPFPSPKRLWLGARLISGASGIIFPIIKAEGVRQMFFPATVPAYYRAPPVK